MGDEQDIQLPIQHKTQRNAHHKAGHCIGASFGRDHAFQLCIIHPDGTQDTILLHSCRHAHGNAVDDVQQGNAANNGKKSIQYDPCRIISPTVLPVAFPQILHNDLITGKSRQRQHGLVTGGAVQLHPDHIVILFSCYTAEQRFRRNKGHIVRKYSL